MVYRNTQDGLSGGSLVSIRLSPVRVQHCEWVKREHICLMAVPPAHKQVATQLQSLLAVAINGYLH